MQFYKILNKEKENLNDVTMKKNTTLLSFQCQPATFAISVHSKLQHYIFWTLQEKTNIFEEHYVHDIL